MLQLDLIDRAERECHRDIPPSAQMWQRYMLGSGRRSPNPLISAMFMSKPP